MEATFVVVGGGIAGVSCAEILTFLEPAERIILVSESPLVKAAVNIRPITKTLSTFDVVERAMESLSEMYPMVTVIQDTVVEIQSKTHTIVTKTNRTLITYQYLCLCMGGKPNIIPQGKHSAYVLGIRDTDSIQTLIEKIGTAKRVAVIGNGGIATELVYKIENAQVEWIIKDKHISATFVDPGAAEFFQSSLSNTATNTAQSQSQTYRTHLKYNQESNQSGAGAGAGAGTGAGTGAALGPDWYNNYKISGDNPSPQSINIHYECEIAQILYSNEHPVKIILNNGTIVYCDLIVSATGVSPNTSGISTDVQLKLSPDDGIQIDDHMNTTMSDVFAAGDVCSPNWPLAKHWFPMRLWSQARQMGCYAAKCMVGKFNCHEQIMQDFCFELFAHSTHLFGYKVVLLGLYNGQKLGTNYECLIRMTTGTEFIKFILENNRLQGAILIGNTDLAETCENLILNQLDLSPYGDDILNPDIDIEDYFD